MRILIAPDKFKGSLSAQQVAENIALGIRDVIPDAQIEIAPVADGGEGTAEVICKARGGEWVTCHAHGPLGNPIEARYVWLSENASAVIEMSEAAGLRALKDGVRDVLRANTFGVGEMLLDGAKRGAREIIVGVGGSVTNDGGFGMARALGFRFFTGRAEQIENGGPVDLIGLARIEAPASGRRVACKVFANAAGTAASTVKNHRGLRCKESVARPKWCDASLSVRKKGQPRTSSKSWSARSRG